MTGAMCFFLSFFFFFFCLLSYFKLVFSNSFFLLETISPGSKFFYKW